MDIETRMALVEQSYENLDKRITSVEHKLDSMRDEMQKGQQGLMKVIIATTGTVMVGLITTIGVIISNS